MNHLPPLVLEISVLLLVVFLGVAVGVPAYSRLLRILSERHADTFNELGRPTLMMGSPSKSIRLQKFIFSPQALATDDAEFTSTVRFVRLFTIVLVAAVVMVFVFILRAVCGVL